MSYVSSKHAVVLVHFNVSIGDFHGDVSKFLPKLTVAAVMEIGSTISLVEH